MGGIWESVEFSARVFIGSLDILGVFIVLLSVYLVTVFGWSWYDEHKAHKRHRQVSKGNK